MDQDILFGRDGKTGRKNVDDSKQVNQPPPEEEEGDEDELEEQEVRNNVSLGQECIEVSSKIDENV